MLVFVTCMMYYLKHHMTAVKMVSVAHTALNHHSLAHSLAHSLLELTKLVCLCGVGGSGGVVVVVVVWWWCAGGGMS